MAAPQHRPSRWALVLAAAGFVVLVVGVGITVGQWTRPVETGWFAYAPLSDTVFNPAMSRPPVLGYCLSVLGALGLGAGTGIALIARRRDR